MESNCIVAKNEGEYLGSNNPSVEGKRKNNGRKHWMDNLRWVTVLLVLFYHVIYIYNNKGVVGGTGGFDGPQYQDVFMYILYPWFMPLLFVLAGVSARYSLEKHSGKEWFRIRTRKLLVPSTIGLFVFQWMTGYFNIHMRPDDVLAGVPGFARYCIWSVAGTGPLWFIQDLWLYSIVLLLLRRLDAKDNLWNLCGKINNVIILGLLGVVLLWLGEKTLIQYPRPESAEGLYNLYKPFFYFVPFVVGYYIFSHEVVHKKIGENWIPLMACAVVSGTFLTVNTWGENNTTPQYLGSFPNCLYGWLMCLAMMGWFKAHFDFTNSFAAYLTRSSYGFYIVHYLVIAGLGYTMKMYTQLPPVAMYVILTIAVFTLSPLLYEALRRIPFIKWCVFGE